MSWYPLMPTTTTTHAIPSGTCARCHGLTYLGCAHFCPTALPLRDLSPLGGGPRPTWNLGGAPPRT